MSDYWKSPEGLEMIEKKKKEVEAGRLVGFGIDLDDSLVEFFAEERPAREEDLPAELNQASEPLPGFDFFEGEVRPGSGLVRSKNGVVVGPRGCAGVFLDTPGSGGRARSHLITAGHLLSKDWKEGVGSTVRRASSGMTGNGRKRTLGMTRFLSPVGPLPSRGWNRLDCALVEVDDKTPTDPDTTCFGGFGGGTKDFSGTFWKCGNEEPVFTAGIVYCYRFWFRIERDGKVYCFEEQILMKTDPVFARPFAKPGDSGTAVARSNNSEVLGMIIAGSVPRDFFVVTPFFALEAFWKEEGLEFHPSELVQRTARSRAAALPPVAVGAGGPGDRRRRLV